MVVGVDGQSGCCGFVCKYLAGAPVAINRLWLSHSQSSSGEPSPLPSWSMQSRLG